MSHENKFTISINQNLFKKASIPESFNKFDDETKKSYHLNKNLSKKSCCL